MYLTEPRHCIRRERPFSRHLAGGRPWRLSCARGAHGGGPVVSRNACLPARAFRCRGDAFAL